jgi:hypothetical protein
MQLNTVRKNKSKKQQIDFAMIHLYQKNESLFSFMDKIIVNERQGSKKISITIGGESLFNGSKDELAKILKKNK